MVGLPYEVSPSFSLSFSLDLSPPLFTFSTSLYFSFTIDFVETASLVLCVNNFSPTRLLAVFTVHHSTFIIAQFLCFATHIYQILKYC